MEVTIKLREEPSCEAEYEWQVVRIDPFGDGWIVCRCATLAGAIVWMEDNSSEEYDYKLQRGALPPRGALTSVAKDLLTAVVSAVEQGGMAKYPNRISYIKAVRNITGLGLKEAKELVEDYLAL